MLSYAKTQRTLDLASRLDDWRYNANMAANRYARRLQSVPAPAQGFWSKVYLSVVTDLTFPNRFFLLRPGVQMVAAPSLVLGGIGFMRVAYWLFSYDMENPVFGFPAGRRRVALLASAAWVGTCVLFGHGIAPHLSPEDAARRELAQKYQLKDMLPPVPLNHSILAGKSFTNSAQHGLIGRVVPLAQAQAFRARLDGRVVAYHACQTLATIALGLLQLVRLPMQGFLLAAQLGINLGWTPFVLLTNVWATLQAAYYSVTGQDFYFETYGGSEEEFLTWGQRKGLLASPVPGAGLSSIQALLANIYSPQALLAALEARVGQKPYMKSDAAYVERPNVPRGQKLSFIGFHVGAYEPSKELVVPLNDLARGLRELLADETTVMTDDGTAYAQMVLKFAEVASAYLQIVYREG